MYPAVVQPVGLGPGHFKGSDPVPLRGDLESLLQGTGLLSTENSELDDF